MRQPREQESLEVIFRQVEFDWWLLDGVPRLRRPLELPLDIKEVVVDPDVTLTVFSQKFQGGLVCVMVVDLRVLLLEAFVLFRRVRSKNRSIVAVLYVLEILLQFFGSVLTDEVRRYPAQGFSVGTLS